MKLTALALLLGMLQISAATLAQKVTLSATNAPLAKVFKTISKQTGYGFMVEGSILKAANPVTISVKDTELETVLSRIFEGQPLTFTLRDQSVIVSPKTRSPLSGKTLRDNSIAARQQPGRISGKVIDDHGEPLPGASVQIVETGRGLQSAVDGRFNIPLPAGIYTVEVSFLGFQTKRVTGVEVKEGQATPLNVVLETASAELGAVTVTAEYSPRQHTVAALNALRKSEVTGIDGITAEQISRTPDNDAGQVVKRITGLHVQNDKYMVVRGVSERYNNVSINGSLMPSTEANRRSYAFDIIPSGLLDNIIVHKTASPALPGEFTGGYVNVNTIDIPQEDFLTFKLGTGMNENTFGDFYSLPRYKGEYLAGVDQASHLPAFSKELVRSDQFGERVGLLALSKEMPGNDRFRLNRYQQQPVQDYSLSGGKIIQTASLDRIGITAALTYRNEQTRQGYFEETHGTREIVGGDRYNFLTRIGGVANAGYSFGTHKIGLKNTFYRKLETENTVYNGIDLYEGWYKRGITEDRLINTYWQSRLEGDHALPAVRDIRLNWNLSIARNKRDQPNNLNILGRNLTYPAPNEGEEKYGEYASLHAPYGYISNRSSEAARDYYSLYREDRYNMGLDIEIPLVKNAHKLIAGYAGSIREADFDQSQYNVMPWNAGPVLGDFLGQPLYGVINQQAFDEEWIYYNYVSAGTSADIGLGNGFDGRQDLHAAYLMLDAHPVENLHFSGGARIEANKMTTNTGIREVDYGENAQISVSETFSSYTVNETDILPSANLIYAVTPRMNARVSYFKSLARPEFTELGKYVYYDNHLRTYIVSGYGNMDENGDPVLVEQTRINNFEARWEFYPTPEESFSITGFYKDFDNPIELQLTQNVNSTEALRASYFNLKRATNYGMEVDFRKSLGFLNNGFGRNFYVFGNASLIWSKVYYDRESVPVETGEEDEDGNPIYRLAVTEENRPLFGQAPYIVNGGLQYTGAHLGVTASYNRVGPRIVLPAGHPEFHEYEKPRDVVDLQIRYAFMAGNRAEVSLNLADLLNDPVVRYQNNIDQETKLVRQTQIHQEGLGTVFIAEDDPSGSNYDSRYDFLRRRFDRQRSFSLNFKYTF